MTDRTGGRRGPALERPVAWQEGMHLHPQHFQQQDRAQREQARFRVDAIDAYPWGLVRLEVDEDRLAEGVVRILRLEMILESGAILQADAGAIADRDLRQLTSAGAEGAEVGLDPLANQHKKGTRFPVFAGLRNATDGTNVYSEHSGEPTRRYKVEAVDVVDFTSEQAAPKRVDTLRSNIRIFFEGEAERENNEVLPVAMVEATGDPKQPYRVAEDFVPPIITLHAAPGLFDAIDGLVKRMRRRVPELARRTAQLDAGDVRWLFARYTLVRMIAVLEHQLSSGRARPFEVYGTLVETAASLASMEVLDVPEIQTYDPFRLGECFGALIAQIDDELEKSWTDRFRKVPLSFRFDAANASERIYEAPLTTDLQKPGNAYYLALQIPQDVTMETVDSILAARKAGAPKDVPFLVEESLTGIAFKERATPPTEISGPKGFVYYELDPQRDPGSRDQWKLVMKSGGAFAIHLGPLEEIEAILYVVFPKES